LAVQWHIGERSAVEFSTESNGKLHGKKLSYLSQSRCPTEDLTSKHDGCGGELRRWMRWKRSGRALGDDAHWERTVSSAASELRRNCGGVADPYTQNFKTTKNLDTSITTL
jgi:predicted alpha/beta hydrolase